MKHTQISEPVTVTHRPYLTPLLSTVRDEVRARRDTRAARRSLERELASYTTPADRQELDTILGRYPTEEVAELRQLIDRGRVA